MRNKERNKMEIWCLEGKKLEKGEKERQRGKEVN
jgi:hypothetical protein